MLKPELHAGSRPVLGRNGRLPLSVLGLGGIAVALCALAGGLWAAPISYHASGPAMEGELRIVGSRATAEPVRRWAAIFNREHPDVRLSVNLSGSGTVVDAMAEGRADLAPLVRPLKVSERALARGAGIRPRAVTVGIHKEGMWPDQPLYLYLKGDEANFIAVEFVRVALSEEGQAALSGSYAPVPEEIRTNADDVAGSSARASTTPWWGDLRGED